MQDKNIIVKKFSINLKKFRKEKGCNQMEVAFSCGISRAGIQKLERGKADVKLSTLVKLAKFYKKSLDDFIK